MATKGAMGRDPKAGGGRASIGRDPMEMRRYQEALNRAKGMDVNSEAYARNKAIAEETGAKYGLNWQKGLTQGAQPRQQQQTPIQNQGFGSYNAPPEASANNQGKYRLSPGVYGTREQAEQQYKESFGQAGGTNGGRPGALSLADRQARGIDPRDPNQYWYTEDGSVAGTLMGYEGMGRGGGNLGQQLGGAVQGIYNAPQPPQQDMTANKQGKYRLSPGMYGNRQQAEQQQARDMAQYNQMQEAARAAQEAIGPQQQGRPGRDGFADRYGQYLGGIGANAGNYYGGIAKGAGDYYGGIAKEAGDYYSGTAKGAGNYYGNVGKETNRSLPAARLGRKFGW